MSEEIKDTAVTPEGSDTPEVEKTAEVTEKPTKGSKGKKSEGGEKAVMANLNDWEAAPVKGRAPKKVEKHPNGITAYHY